MNFPSHANSSVGQVANAYAGNPQALMQRTQPQNGVTPELIDLLALQKLQAEKESAARQMAMANGQQPPTVAQGMAQQATQTARQEIAQKLGLPGLMSQGQPEPAQGSGQPPPGAPGTDLAQQRPQQPPAPPTQTMAQGGLVRLRSNLPSRYASGGIVAFEEGGPTFYGTEAMRGVSAGTKETPDDEKDTSMWDRWMKSLSESQLADVMRKATSAYDSVSGYKPTTPRAPEAPKTEAAPAQGAPGAPPNIDAAVAAAIRGANGDINLRNKLFSELTATYGVDALDAAIARTQTPSEPAPALSQAPAPSPNVGSGSGDSSRSSVRVGLPGVMDDTDSEFGKQVKKSVTDTFAMTPASERDKGAKYYQDTTGQSFKAMQDAQASGLAKLQELQAREQAQRPSNLMRGLQLMGRNIHATGGIGGAFQGVGEGIDATNAGYTQQDIKMQSDLNTLDIAMKKAAQENDIGAYNAAQKAYDKILDRISSAQSAGASIMNADEAANARRFMAATTAQERRDRLGNDRTARDADLLQKQASAIETQLRAAAKAQFPYDEVAMEAAYQKGLQAHPRYPSIMKALGLPMEAGSPKIISFNSIK